MKYILIFLILISSAFALNYHGCTLAPDNLHGWVVCLDTALIFHTTDGGDTWLLQDVPVDSTKRFFDVTCVDQYLAWTCGILGEILHTDNGGFDWYQQIIGFSKYGTRIEFIDEYHGWAAGGDGALAMTTNGGGFWEQIFTNWAANEYYGISFVNQWDGWMVAGYPDSMLTGQGFIVRSTDGGLTWDSLYQSLTYEDFFDVHFFNVFDGIIVGGDEADTSVIILKTTDGGLSWNPISAPANSYYLRAVDFVGDEGWAVGRFGTIIHTTNGGNSWASQTSPATTTLFDVDFTDNLHGIACGYDIVLLTTDGGQNWHEPTSIESIEEHQNPKNYEHNIDIGLEIYPNPFRKLINISFSTGQSAKGIALKIYDVSGRLVRFFNLASDFLPLASTISWDGMDNNNRRVSEGVYFVRLVVDRLGQENYQKTEKIIFLK